MYKRQEQQVAYNVAIGSITWWGFLIIGVPILVALVFIMTRLIKRLGRLTGLKPVYYTHLHAMPMVE